MHLASCAAFQLDRWRFGNEKEREREREGEREKEKEEKERREERREGRRERERGRLQSQHSGGLIAKWRSRIDRIGL